MITSRRGLFGWLVAMATGCRAAACRTRDIDEVFAHNQWSENRRLLARHMQGLLPSFGTCGRCEWPWPVLRSHMTRYGKDGTGCFPLCEDCWSELGTPERRWPYYATLIDSWAVMGSPTESAAAIKAAVEAGR